MDERSFLCVPMLSGRLLPKQVTRFTICCTKALNRGMEMINPARAGRKTHREIFPVLQTERYIYV